MLRILLLFLPALCSATVLAQQVESLHTGNIVELECVQTPQQTFIAATMERVRKPDAIFEVVVLYRSSDLGMTWEMIDTVHGMDGAADPVLAVDENGTIYLVIMSVIREGGIFADIELYRSEDDGRSWNYVSSPNTTGLGDYPQVIARGDGEVSISFTRFFWQDTTFASTTYFTRSSDAGQSWSTETAFPVESGNTVGADMTWLADGRLMLSFGNYTDFRLNAFFSSDQGESWSEQYNLEGADTYTVTKPLANPKAGHFGILSHTPHKDRTAIKYHYTLDNGESWQNTVVSNGAYAQGLIDEAGTVHVVFNSFEGEDYALNYVTSGDGGKSFSEAVQLYSAPHNSTELGEYQAFFKAIDGKMYVCFCDWSDGSRAKMLVFPSSVSVAAGEKPETAFLYPNPTKGLVSLDLAQFSQLRKIGIYDTQGKPVAQYSPGGEDPWQADCSHLAAGVYFVRIEEANRIFIEQLVKQ